MNISTTHHASAIRLDIEMRTSATERETLIRNYTLCYGPHEQMQGSNYYQ